MVKPAEFDTGKSGSLRQRVSKMVESNAFINFITALILINAVTLGLETNDALWADYGTILHLFDMVILGIFVIEIALKLFAYRLTFFRNGWNDFDFIIVGISLFPAAGPFSILRTFRVFRVLRLISVVPRMRRVVAALLHAIPGMTSIIAVLLVIFYVCAVLVTQLFGGEPRLAEEFGTFSDSMFTLFQLMTLEGWVADIADPTMEIFPWSWAFFVFFIVVTSFAVLNLFIGIIVDAMHIVKEEDLEKETDEVREDARAIRQEIQAMRRDLDEIRTALQRRD